MRRALLALLMMVLPGCYIGVRGGPAFHSRGGVPVQETGFELDVTAGIEMHFDGPPMFNPLAGKARLAVGGGGFGSSSPQRAADPRQPRALAPAPPGGGGFDVDAGLLTLEAGHTLARRVSGGTERDPRQGSMVRATGSLGIGSGTIALLDDPRGGGAEVELMGVSAGVEAGLHTGGSTIDSVGIFVGTGVRWTRFSAPGLAPIESVSPYLSLVVEGGVVLQLFIHALCRL